LVDGGARNVGFFATGSAWSVVPLGEDRILVADSDEGLFHLRPDGAVCARAFLPSLAHD